MKRYFPVILLGLLIACNGTIPPPDPNPPKPKIVNVQTNVSDALVIVDDSPQRKGITNDSGFVSIEVSPSLVASHLWVTKPTYKDFDQHIDIIGQILDVNVTLELIDLPQPPIPEDKLRAWRGAITIPVNGLPRQLLFTAQGYDTEYDESQRALARSVYKNEGYTHWAYGPILQRGYHGEWPDSDFRNDPTQFIDRAKELRKDGIIPVLFLLDDFCNYACENGGIYPDAIERDLTPIYSTEDFQKTFPIVVAGWEPNWRTKDWKWVTEWMARVFPEALRCVHFKSNHSAPGTHDDFTENGGDYETAGDMWNEIIPNIHCFLMQESYTFSGEQVDSGRTPEEQFIYDLMDKSRRFRYGRGPNAPTSGSEVDRWNEVRKEDPKMYNSWDGEYDTTGAKDRPIDIVAFEYASYFIKDDPSLYSKAKMWGQLALTVVGIFGFGDGG